MSADVPQWLRTLVEARAGECCEYCLAPRFVVAAAAQFHVEHTVPRSRGGTTIESNLALSCPCCNLHKAARRSAIDPVGGDTVALFNPRAHVWSEHFMVDRRTGAIIGRTATGRATVSALHLNEPLPLEARVLWIDKGWYPPRGLA